MTRKDYVAIAAAFRAEVEHGANAHGHTVVQRLADRVADVLADDNPRFDRERFLVACGIAHKQAA